METGIIVQKKPLDYLKVFFRRKWFIIIPTLIGLIAGIVAVNVLPRVYQASTLVLVEEGRVINPLIEGLAVSTSVAQRLTILREQILGWDRINQLISKLGLANNVRSQKEFEGLVKHLRKNIRVTLRGHNIIHIVYRGEDPENAKNIVKTITDLFIAENLNQQERETDNAISFINDQLALYQKKLKQGEITEMQEKLSTLMLDSTGKHPMVIELNKKIEAGKKDLELGRYRLDSADSDTQSSEIKSLKEELKGFREELTTSSLDANKGGANRAKLASATNEKLYKLLLLERVNTVTSADAGVNKKLYDELLSRLETAKITQRLEASRDGTRYTVLDPARMPLTPVAPNKLYVLMAGIFFGMCTGMGLVFLMEMLDRSFLSVEESRAHIDLPFLGAISKIVTEKDVALQKVRNIRITGASVLVGLTLFVVIVFNVLLGG